jgi:hypothetical protein
VYRARDPDLGREVALKVLLPDLAADPKAKARFLREARAQARVDHDHIVPIHDVGETDGFAYLVMPLLKGQSLKDALKKNPRPPVPEVARIGREIAEGLSAAHAAGLTHRDIKPGNVWLEGDRRRVKILDFGLARATGDAPDAVSTSRPKLVSAELTAAGGIVGTPAYMSPEQARGLPTDARSDVFSLGIVLYEMATGRKPFTGSTAFDIMAAVASDEPFPVAQLAPHLPPALAALISRMLAKDAAARPQNCTEVTAALAALAGPQVVVLPPDAGGAPSVWEDLTAAESDTAPEPDRTEAERGPEPPAPRARPKWLWPAVSAAVLLAAGVGATLVLRGKPAEQAKADPEPPKPVPKLQTKTGTQPTNQPKPAAGDEVVLFDGTAASLANWRTARTGGEGNWLVQGSYLAVMPGRGNIYSAEKFRDHTIHLEYWLPTAEKDDGNSGVYVHGCYEVTILNDAGKPVTNTTSGGIYGMHAPLKNASKPAGEWQTLDITFTAARAGQLPRVSVVHNGEKVLDGAEMTANTPLSLPQLVVDNAGPVMLQDHGSRVRFRDVRVRRLDAPVATRTRGQFVAAVNDRGGNVSCKGKPVSTAADVPDGATGVRLVLVTGKSQLAPWVGNADWNTGQVHDGSVRSPFGSGELAALDTFAPRTFDWLILVGQPVADADLERVLGFPSMRDLTVLEVMNCGAGDATVRAASRLPNLKALDLNGTRVTNDALKRLPGDTQALQRLSLRGTHLTNGAAEHLKRLVTLRSLDLRETEVSEATAQELAVALPKCWIAYGTDQRIGPKDK